MRLNFVGTCLQVQRQTGDPPARNESHLLYQIQQQLNDEGDHWQKRLMWKDGHMVADSQHYLKMAKRHRLKDYPLYIYDCAYAIRNSAQDYNNYGEVILTVVLHR
jgi:hypothetical protein